ncbi:hypothetical protein KC573_01970, partial [candidate division WWE3 bacterium]|nr:hypothetical protein [candidate division WWE3 bacterium]
MLKKLPAIDYIVIFLRLFLKTLGIYVLLNLEIASPLVLIAVITLIMSELYEFPLMFLAQKSRSYRTTIFIVLGFLNSLMVLGLISIIGQLQGDLYLFLVATVIGLSIGGGFTAGIVSSLIAATGYTLLGMQGEIALLSISIRAIFIMFIGTITGILAEVVYHLQ